MKMLSRNLFVTILILFAIAIGFSLISELSITQTVKKISLTELAGEINAGAVTTLLVSGDTITGELTDKTLIETRKEAETGLTETLTNYGVKPEKLQSVSIDIKEPSGFQIWAGILLPILLPLIIMITIFWFIFRRSQSGMNQAFSFGRANVKLFQPFKDRVTFKDVAGLKEAKEELLEVVDFLKNPKKYLEIGARIPRGVLLMGPPGSGKTLLARAIAGESGVPFFHMSGSEFVEMFVGVGSSVTGDTPILVKTKGEVKLIPIHELIDRYYQENEEGKVKPAQDIEVLGYAPLTSKFYGSRSKSKKFFGGSAWTKPKGVLRHRVNEIYEITYRGGTIKTTEDHSIFVRNGNMIQAKRADELRVGDILVNLPFKVRSAFIPGLGTTHKVRAHQFPNAGVKELDLFEEQTKEWQEKYAFALQNRELVSQSAIGKTIGVSQATIKNWQLGQHHPRFLTSNVFEAGTSPKIAVTPDLMRLLGYYTAEGRTTDYYTQFVFGLHEKNLHADCAQLIKTIFALEPTLTEVPETNSMRINISSPIIARFFKTHCGNGSHNKHIPPFLWELPKEYFLAYLNGYWKGDGHTSEGKIIITSVSQQIIRELAWLSSMHGIQAGVSEAVTKAGRTMKGGKPLPETRAWRLIISKNSNPFETKAQYPDQWKKPIITSIVKRAWNDYVYDVCGCENEAFFGGEKPLLLHNSRVRDLFETAKKAAPAIIFIDEIDAIGRERGAGLGGGHDEREQTLNQILVEMDGFDRETNIIVTAATNRPDILDSALLRPGRFDRRVVLDLPDINEREAILKIHIKGKPLEKGVDLKTVAVRTPGFSGADLANLLNEAAIYAARENHTVVSQEDILGSIEKVILGPARKSKVISQKEKEITAYHEAGHALVAAGMKHADPVHKISIISRGMAGGYTLKLPTEDRHLKTKAQFMAELAVAFGGYASESIVFKDVTTGSAHDIRQATDLVRRAVTQFGMSEKLGPRTFGKTQELIFLGREISTEKDYSEKVGEVIDSEVNIFISKALAAAKKVIGTYRTALDVIAKTLIEKETIEQEEFYKIVKRFNLKPVTI